MICDFDIKPASMRKSYRDFLYEILTPRIPGRGGCRYHCILDGGQRAEVALGRVVSLYLSLRTGGENLEGAGLGNGHVGCTVGISMAWQLPS